ncbi:hypothetical protein M885DRAFT_574337 [Pelagophyceae sp. CCMP2097]|nr:hypothetical protein M885DRAFT_574337 [Pelagophyceae sp. CCMP2097]
MARSRAAPQSTGRGRLDGGRGTIGRLPRFGGAPAPPRVARALRGGPGRAPPTGVVSSAPSRLRATAISVYYPAGAVHAASDARQDAREHAYERASGPNVHGGGGDAFVGRG